MPCSSIVERMRFLATHCFCTYNRVAPSGGVILRISRTFKDFDEDCTATMYRLSTGYICLHIFHTLFWKKTCVNEISRVKERISPTAMRVKFSPQTGKTFQRLRRGLHEQKPGVSIQIEDFFVLFHAANRDNYHTPASTESQKAREGVAET